MTSNSSLSSTRRHLFVVERSSSSLPRYLFRRGDTLYFKRKIPVDVAYGFPESKGQMWKSLGTNLVEKAKVLLAVEVTEFDLRVAELRREQAAHWAADRSAAEAAAQGAPAVEKPVLAPEVQAGQILAREPVREPLRDYAEPLARQPVQAMVVRTPPQLRQPAEPPRTVAVVARRVQGPLVGQAVAPTVYAAPARPAAARPHPASPQAASPTVVKPAKAAPPPGPSRPSMLHLFEDWKRKQTRPRTVNAVHTAVMEFRTLHGQLAVDELTKAHARAYRDYLIERSLSKGTVENRLGFLATLLRHGMKEMVEHLVVNPFERIEVTGATGVRVPKDRRAYDVSELNTLFASRLYTDGYRPDGQCVDAAYWAPLLGPFLGARIEEVCQLRVADVQRINGTWCVRICDLDEDQNVKTASSFRRVPLHESVIKAGFLVYAGKMAKAGQDRLFPTLTNDNANGIYSNAVGKWYGRYMETIGLDDHRLDYHSFRYTFRQQCSLCGMENEVRDALTGHWLSNNDSGRTYMKAENRQYPFPKLVAAMSHLNYEEMRIAHLFVADPMEGVEGSLLR